MNPHHRLKVIGLALLSIVVLCLDVAAATKAGPKGGRLLEAAPNPAEFFVTPEQRIEIVFYDSAMQPIAPTHQVVGVTAEAPGGRTALDVERTAQGYVTTAPVPAGAPYRVVVQIRAAPGEKPQNFRVDLNMTTCGECSHAEYACTCEGH